MSKLDDDIESAKVDFNNYLRKRQKHIDIPSKFRYYDEKLLIREERLFRLLSKKKKQTTGEKNER